MHCKGKKKSSFPDYCKVRKKSLKSKYWRETQFVVNNVSALMLQTNIAPKSAQLTIEFRTSTHTYTPSLLKCWKSVLCPRGIRGPVFKIMQVPKGNI